MTDEVMKERLITLVASSQQVEEEGVTIVDWHEEEDALYVNAEISNSKVNLRFPFHQEIPHRGMYENETRG